MKDGLGQDIFKSDQQRDSVVVKEECSHLNRLRDIVVIVKKETDATKRSGDSRMVGGSYAVEPAAKARDGQRSNLAPDGPGDY